MPFDATPLGVCGSRDRKDLCAKTQAGIIRKLTGISDPYGAPEDPEMRIDTAELAPDLAAHRILIKLESLGFIRQEFGGGAAQPSLAPRVLAGRTAERADGMSESGQLQARPRASGEVTGAKTGLRPLGLTNGRDGLIYVPESVGSGQATPLVVLLHGAGGDARQIVPLLREQADARGIVLLAPDSRGRTWDVILGDYGPDVAFLDRALERVFARHAVDPKRLAIGGFSDGASYALSLGLINGTLFTHVLAFSPGFMAPTRPADSPRFFVSHGVADDVLPIERTSRRLAPELRRAGYEVEYREFAGGHVAPPEIVRAGVDWFLGSG